jgi:replicative DNA helicase
LNCLGRERGYVGLANFPNSQINTSSAAHSDSVHGGRHSDRGSSVDSEDEANAIAIIQLIYRRSISERTRKAFSRDWSGLAEFVESSTGLDPETLWGRVHKQYLSQFATRHPDNAKILLDALEASWKQFAATAPGDEPQESEGRQSFQKAIRGAADFDRTEFKISWLVKGVRVADQPAVVGAPKKSMKTSIMVDLAISVASGERFLGKFETPQALPVLLLSGESGGFTLQETIRRVCRSKGLDGIDVDLLDGNLFIGDELPSLGLDEDRNDLATFIQEKKISLVVLDPLYLCLCQGISGRRLDPSNLFDVGPQLLSVSRACLRAGATPVLVHHFKKGSSNFQEMPQMEELAYAGIQEFARQWMLISRRAKFEPGSGIHKLWLSVGGSAGHSGDWAVDIDEGVMGDDFKGRKWSVTVRSAAEGRDQANADRQKEKALGLASREQAKADARAHEDSASLAELIQILAPLPDRKATQRRLRVLTRWNPTKLDRICQRGVREGSIRAVQVTVPCGKNQTKECPGWELFEDSGVAK